MPVKLENISSISPTAPGQIEVTSDVNLTGTPPPVYRINGVPISTGGGSSQWTDIAGGGIYYNGGNVGIGTTTPAFTLDVKAVAGDAVALRLTGSASGSNNCQLRFAGPGGELWSIGTDIASVHGDFQFFNMPSTTVMALQNVTGNVGIGTATPSSRLVVCAEASNVSNQLNLRPSDGNNTYGLGIGYTILNSDWRGTLQVLADNLAYPLILQPWGGNVGINAINPAGRLQVEQPPGGNWNLYLSQSSASWLTANDFNNYRFIQTASAASDGNFKYLAVGAGGVGILYAPPPYGSNDALYVNGNVGIGTVNPLTTLDVAGNIRMSGVRTVLFFQGDAASQQGGVQIVGGLGDNNVMLTPTDNSGNPVNGAIRIGGMGAFNSNSVNLLVGGYVGIGVTAPTFALDVSTPIRIRNTGGISGVWYDNAWSTERFFVGTEASQDIWRVYTAVAGNIISLTPSGNVGVGTDLPSARLQSNTSAWTPFVNGINGMSICASGGFGGGIGIADGPNVIALYSTNGNLMFGTGFWDSPTTARMTMGANGCFSVGTTIIGDQISIQGLGANGYGQLRIVEGPYGSFWRQDSASLYLMTTNVNDPWGTWKAPFAFQVDLGSNTIGICASPNPSYGLSVGGNLNITGNYYINGTLFMDSSYGAAIQRVIFQSQNATQLSHGGPITTIGVTVIGGATMVFNNLAGYGGMWQISAAAGCDERLKQTVQPLTGGLEIIDQLHPVLFEWNGLLGHAAGQKFSGVLAQELQPVVPEAVCLFPARLNPEDTDDTDVLLVEPMPIIAHLILAVQELKRQVESLKGKVN